MSIEKISSVSSRAIGSIISGAPKPQQAALQAALKGEKLPVAARRFMALVRAGIEKTAHADNIERVVVSQVPEGLAEQLVALQSNQGVARFAATLLTQASDDDVKELVATAHKTGVTQPQLNALDAALQAAKMPRGNADPLMQVLLALPPAVAQSILNARHAAIMLFLNEWAESLRKNAELDAAAAKEAAKAASQNLATQRRTEELARGNTALSIKKQATQRANRKLDPTTVEFAAQLLAQRIAVFTNTLALVGMGGAVSAAFFAAPSVDGAEPPRRFQVQLAPSFNVATLDALNLPQDDVGVSLTPLRGRAVTNY